MEDSKLRHKIYSILSKTLLVLFILLLTLTLLSVLGIPKGFRVFTVMSGSMSPTITEGSVIFVIPQDNYDPQDIVTFEKTDNAAQTITVTHRIIDKTQDSIGQSIFVTKGDANNIEDMEPLYTYQIIGKELFHIPLIGYPISFAKTRTGVILLVLVPALILAFVEFIRIRNDLDKMRFQPQETAKAKDKELKKVRLLYFISVSLFLLGSLSSTTRSSFSSAGNISSNSLESGLWAICSNNTTLFTAEPEISATPIPSPSPTPTETETIIQEPVITTPTATPLVTEEPVMVPPESGTVPDNAATDNI